MVKLSSGAELVVTKVGLYPQSALQHLADLKRQATESLGGVSSGIGFIGSPGYVLSGALALGVFEGILSRSATKRGLKYLAEYQECRLSISRNPVFFPVKNVANFSMPIPGSWSAVSSAGKRGMQEVYVHNGEEFVAMKGANDRPYYIRWTDVSIYEPQASTGRLVT